MKKLILFSLLGCSVFVFGQEDLAVNVPMDARNATGEITSYGTGAWLPGRSIDNSIEGSPYLFPKWDDAFEIFATESKGYKILNLNYNVATKTLESKVAKDSVFQFDKDKVSFVKHDSEKYKFYEVNNSNELYKIIYSSDKVVFLKGFDLAITKRRINPMADEILFKRKYDLKEKFVVNFNNSVFYEIELKKRPILKLMGDKSSQVQKFASQSKLSFKSEKDLFKIFQYYDSL